MIVADFNGPFVCLFVFFYLNKPVSMVPPYSGHYRCLCPELLLLPLPWPQVWFSGWFRVMMNGAAENRKEPNDTLLLLFWPIDPCGGDNYCAVNSQPIRAGLNTACLFGARSHWDNHLPITDRKPEWKHGSIQGLFAVCYFKSINSVCEEVQRRPGQRSAMFLLEK